MWEELNNLPLIVTRHNSPAFKVDVVPGGFKPHKVEFVPEKILEKNLGKCTFVSNSPMGRFPCHNPATIEREGGNVCEEHK